MCCFKCLDCWIKTSDTLFCCQCYTNWLAEENEFSKAAQEYSSSISKDKGPLKPQSDDEDLPKVADGKSNSSTTTIKSLKSLPTELQFHLRHSTSIYSTKHIVRPLSASKSKKKMKRQKSTQSLASSGLVSPVAMTRQLSTTTHAELSMLYN